MNKKIIGIALIIAGVALAMWGYDVYNSVSAQATRAFSGESPVKAWAAMIGGVAAVFVGITQVK